MAEAAVESERRCANPDCRVQETGRCVEGIQLEECPNFGKDRDVSGNSGQPDQSIRSGTQVRTADHLDPAAAAVVMRGRLARVIAIVGPHEAGKTTLLASLYDLFQMGPIDGHTFAGSATLYAFERACHDARCASRRTTPVMERTKHGQLHFYHIDIATPANGLLALLLADRAGEEYRESVDDISNAASFHETRRADVLTLLIDGRRLTNPLDRHNVIADATDTLQALIEAEAIRRHQRIAIVLTKRDLVEKSPECRRALSDFHSLSASIERRFARQFSEFRSFEVAARPSDKSMELGTGVASLLAYWIQSSASPGDVPIHRSTHQRLFARFGHGVQPEAQE